MSLFKNETVYTPNIVGIVDGSAAKPGSVGETVSTLVAVGSPVSLVTNTPKDVATVALTPGEWMVYANVNLTGGSTTVAAAAAHSVGINTTSATLPTDGTEVPVALPTLTTTSFKAGVAIPGKKISVTANQTVYLVASVTFTAGTVGGYGSLTARRIR